jgi:hypothetical protein
LLQDHRRVREAAEGRGSYQVTASLPVDVMGLYVLLPDTVSATNAVGPDTMAKRLTHQLAYRAIRIEGGLIPADELTRLTLLPTPRAPSRPKATTASPRA